MYTSFLTLTIIFIALGCIFKWEIKQNIISIIGILLLGSLLSTTFVNGVIGFNSDWKPYVEKTYTIKIKEIRERSGGTAGNLSTGASTPYGTSGSGG